MTSIIIPSCHWSGDYKTPNREIVALPQLDYVCIDAYHRTRKTNDRTLADIIWNGTQNKRNGLGTFNKPIVITEFGGSSSACPEPQLLAEHEFAAWACLVSGYGTGPMLWWFEWVDQGDRFGPYRAIQRFLVNEDLRRQDPKAIAQACGMDVASEAGPIWCRGWYRQGHLLGYMADRHWTWNGDITRHHDNAQVIIGDNISAGRMQIEWWDADQGTIATSRTVEHPGVGSVCPCQLFSDTSLSNSNANKTKLLLPSVRRPIVCAPHLRISSAWAWIRSTFFCRSIEPLSLPVACHKRIWQVGCNQRTTHGRFRIHAPRRFHQP